MYSYFTKIPFYIRNQNLLITCFDRTATILSILSGNSFCLCLLCHIFPFSIRVRNIKFARNLKFATSKTLVNFMKKMMFLSKNWYFSVQKALIYYTVNKSHHNSFILLVFSPVANFRYVANFRFLTLIPKQRRVSLYTLDNTN